MTDYDLDLSDPPTVEIDVEGVAIARRQRRERRAAFIADIASVIASGRRVPSGDLYRAARWLNRMARADEALVAAESNKVTV